jgi:spore germination protein GerM
MRRNRVSYVSVYGSVCVILSFALPIAACGLQTDSAPRPIDEGVRAELESESQAATPVAGGQALIYLTGAVTADQSVSLQAVTRDVSVAAGSLADALAQGPSEAESAAQLTTQLPLNLQLTAVSVRAGVVTVDATPELDALTGDALVAALAQIVFTMTTVPDVSAVVVTVAGEGRQWPDADGAFRARPLTRFDYPGLAVSSQPAIPAVLPPASSP